MKKIALLLTIIIIFTAFPLNAGAAEKFSLDKPALTLAVGESFKFTPSGANEKISWSIKGNGCIDFSGRKVTGKAVGEAVLTAKSGGVTDTCVVKVQKYRLSDGERTMSTGDKLTLSVIGETQNKKISWTSSDKDTASVSGTGVITAKKAGSVKITANINGSKLSRSFTIKKAAQKTAADSSNNSTADNLSTSTTGEATLKSVYAPIFGYIGAAVTYNQGWGGAGGKQMLDSATLEFIKKHNNSITMGNEMKPDAIISNTYGTNGTVNTITLESAKANKNYVIPSGYSEKTVPIINFSKIDSILKAAKENGLKVRFHTLIWTDQIPAGFFKSEYKSGGEYVSEAVMNKRVEFYVKTVVNYIHSGNYKDVIYAYDVVNEHVNKSGNEYIDPDTKLYINHWYKVYGAVNSYVILAFKSAHEALVDCNMRDKVSLFYNDYNENAPSVHKAMIKLIKEINSTGVQYCDGVGMQGHYSVDGNWYGSVSDIANAIDAFKKELPELEIQITELDVGLNGKTLEQQAKYYGDLFKTLVAKKKEGANITSITIWGLFDSESWRKENSPLLFTGIDEPKPAYYAVIDAASS